VNQKIRALRRRGKYLVLDLGRLELVIHLGMSGRLLVPSRELVTPHIRAVFELNNGHSLVFVDRRRFGILKVVRSGEHSELPTLAAMGPEPLSADFRVAQFAAATAASTATIKSLLLEQRVVAGLGNIYVDEALHRAGIHPTTRSLSSVQAKRLH